MSADRRQPPGDLLRSLRKELNLSQTEFAQYYDRSGILTGRIDRAEISRAERWGKQDARNDRPVNERLLQAWWECYDYWWRRLNRTPPKLALNDLLAMVHRVDEQAQLVRSLGKRLVTIRFFGDSGGQVETYSGMVRAAAFFGLKHVADFPCGGRPVAFVQACKAVRSREGADACHMVVVELPPDGAYDAEAYDALHEMIKHGEDGFRHGLGYVTVVSGLSPLHDGIWGTRDPRKEIGKQLVQLAVDLVRQQRRSGNGITRIVTVIGGAACVAYNRNDEVVPALIRRFGDVVTTETAHPGSSKWIRGVIRRYVDDLRPQDRLLVMPLYFSATRLLAELVPSWDERVTMISTDICQDFITRMGEFPDHWRATVATDLFHTGIVAVALAERLALARIGSVDEPPQPSLNLPPVVVSSAALDVRTPLAAVRQDWFTPALRQWIAADDGIPWLAPVIDGIFPDRPRTTSAVQLLQSLPLPYASSPTDGEAADRSLTRAASGNS